ncbi:hypothetical protein Metvu_0326 [Methanocaldococcus vulcanius M7]|uniref:Uncharacterized protein n=1 Tax=Methanocaldococcus vulcanius (strain ATCC 700851 / DSM 12094 / M7) TaxID=579137 RepID=C9RF41_METVM|nr:hypothetical protein Metvu_0326 [Methanocaldococcus vulcanius M7]
MNKLPIILTLIIFSLGFIVGFISINNLSKINDKDLSNFKPKIQFNFPIILTNNLKVIFLMLAGAITFGLVRQRGSHVRLKKETEFRIYNIAIPYH